MNVRWLSWAALASVSAAAAAVVGTRGFDDDPLAALPGPSAPVERFREVAHQFGLDRTLVVGYEPGTLWSFESLSRLRAATRALAADTAVERADSVTELLDLSTTADGEADTTIAPLIDEIPRDAPALAELRTRVGRSLAGARLVSRDQRAALIVVKLRSRTGGAGAVVARLRDVATRALGAGEVHVLGAEAAAAEATASSKLPLAISLPVAILSAFALLVWIGGWRFAASRIALWVAAAGAGLAIRVFVAPTSPLALVESVFLLAPVALLGSVAAFGARRLSVATAAAALFAGVPFSTPAALAFSVAILVAGLLLALITATYGLPAGPVWPQVRFRRGAFPLVAELALIAMAPALGWTALRPAGARSALPPSSASVRAEDWYAARFGIVDTIFIPITGDLRDPQTVALVDAEVEAYRARAEVVVRVDAITDVMRLLAKGFGGSDKLPETRAQVDAILGLVRGQGEISSLMQRVANDAVRTLVIVHLSRTFSEALFGQKGRWFARHVNPVGPSVAMNASHESQAAQAIVALALGVLVLGFVVLKERRPLPGFNIVGIAALVVCPIASGQSFLTPLICGAIALMVISVFSPRPWPQSDKLPPASRRALLIPFATTAPFAVLFAVPVATIAWTGLGLLLLGLLATVSALAFWRSR